MNVYGGVVFSQRVLLALVGSGMSRRCLPGGATQCHTAWNTEGGNFRDNLEGDADVTGRLSETACRLLRHRCAPGQSRGDLGSSGDLDQSPNNPPTGRPSRRKMDVALMMGLNGSRASDMESVTLAS